MNMIVCERDPLLDDQYRFAERMVNSGVRLQVFRLKDAPHGILSLENGNLISEANNYV